MKRLAVLVIATIVLVAAVFIIAPLFVSDELARARVAEQITQWIGRPVNFSGEPEVTLFPQPRVVLHDVVIEDGDGSGRPFIEVEELAGSIRVWPLLLGRVEIGSFELTRPTIALRIDETGNSNWWFESGTLGDRINAAFEDAGVAEAVDRDEVVLGSVTIRDGTITYEEPGLGVATLSNVSLELSWPKTSATATAEGSVTWRDEPLLVSATLTDPLELISGRNSPMRFTIAGTPIRIDFDGEIGRTDLEFAFVGDTDVTMNSLRRVIRWAGADISESEATLGPAAISGQASWSWPLLSFANAEMRLDGNSASGAIMVDFSGDRLSVGGTFAADELDISPYTNSFRAEINADDEWVDTVIDIPVLDSLNTDIRVSADRLQIGDSHLEAFAGSLVVNDGQLSLRLGQSTFYGGTIEVNVTGDYDAPHLAVTARVAVNNIDSRSAMADIFGVTALSGIANGRLDIAGEGDRWGELVTDLSGEVSGRIVNGTVRGIDLEGVAAMPTPTVEAIAVDGAMTPFSAIEAALLFSEGRLAADRIEATGPGFDLDFGGWGSLTSPEVGGEGVVSFPRGGETRALPFELIGTWLEPRFVDTAITTVEPQ